MPLKVSPVSHCTCSLWYKSLSQDWLGGGTVCVLSSGDQRSAVTQTANATAVLLDDAVLVKRDDRNGKPPKHSEPSCRQRSSQSLSSSGCRSASFFSVRSLGAIVTESRESLLWSYGARPHPSTGLNPIFASSSRASHRVRF